MLGIINENNTLFLVTYLYFNISNNFKILYFIKLSVHHIYMELLIKIAIFFLISNIFYLIIPI